MLASPADFGGEPVQPRWRAPLLGEHTGEILRELGRDDAEIRRLHADGTVSSQTEADP
jgi:crotonobetainyl-CoA:carnitine CoA-transferase CaiB-like acyl-CoA transferase